MVTAYSDEDVPHALVLIQIVNHHAYDFHDTFSVLSYLRRSLQLNQINALKLAKGILCFRIGLKHFEKRQGASL